MGQEYYRRRLKANKMRRLIASRRAAIRNFRILLRLFLIVAIAVFGLKALKLPGWYLNQDLRAGMISGIISALLSRLKMI